MCAMRSDAMASDEPDGEWWPRASWSTGRISLQRHHYRCKTWPMRSQLALGADTLGQNNACIKVTSDSVLCIAGQPPMMFMGPRGPFTPAPGQAYMVPGYGLVMPHPMQVAMAQGRGPPMFQPAMMGPAGTPFTLRLSSVTKNCYTCPSPC